MSSSHGDDRGKGIAQDQSSHPQRLRRPSRREVMEEVSRVAAERIQVSSNFIKLFLEFIIS